MMVDVEREGGVARIFLNRPEKANALSSAMLGELAAAVASLAQDSGLRALVLAGRGKAFCGGAGLEIAAACDLRLAAEGTKLAMPEVRLGIPSVVEAALLPRLMGSGRAAWLVLTGEAIDARRALEWGLVEELGGDDAVQRLLGRLLAGDREALRVQKELLQLWEEAPLATSVRVSIDRFREGH